MRREPGQHMLCEEPAVLKLILAFQSTDYFFFFLMCDVLSFHTTCSGRNNLMSEESGKYLQAVI